MTFLDNLVLLAAAWDGPISVAIYAPGSDFETATQSIAYLRHCNAEIRQKVSFHFVFEEKYYDNGEVTLNWPLKEINITHCNNQMAPWLNLPQNKTYKQVNLNLIKSVTF